MTWADWTVLSAINVVNNVRYSGDLDIGRRYFDAMIKFHTYSDWLPSPPARGSTSTNVADDAAGDGRARSRAAAVVDTSTATVSTAISTSEVSDTGGLLVDTRPTCNHAR